MAGRHREALQRRPPFLPRLCQTIRVGSTAEAPLGVGALQMWDGCDAALSSRLAYPEVCAALAAAHRSQDLDDHGYALAARDWDDFWAAIRPVELAADVERQAGALAHSRALRGADAVHLATAMAVDDHNLLIAVWDRRLHQSAVSQHLSVAPAELPS